MRDYVYSGSSMVYRKLQLGHISEENYLYLLFYHYIISTRKAVHYITVIPYPGLYFQQKPGFQPLPQQRRKLFVVPQVLPGNGQCDSTYQNHAHSCLLVCVWSIELFMEHCSNNWLVEYQLMVYYCKLPYYCTLPLIIQLLSFIVGENNYLQSWPNNMYVY